MTALGRTRRTATALMLAGFVASSAGLTGVAFAQTAPARAATGAITQDVLTLTTADGVSLPALLSTPAAGYNPSSPAIVFIPDGPGLSPLRAGTPPRFLAEALAARGYVSLGLETRLTARYSFSRFDESVTDVKAAVDALIARGTTSVVLAGHGLGSLIAARYMVDAGDARVKALIFISPSPDLAEDWRAKAGEERYWKTVDRASKAVNEGGRGAFIDLGDGLIFTPPTFLDWYGPTAKTSLTANMASLDKPMFLAAGDKDSRVPKGRLEALKAIAFLSKQVDTKTYAGGQNIAEQQDALTTDIATWLADNNLPVLANVRAQVVTVTAKDGTPLDGVIYRPAGTVDMTRPAFVIAHGWGSDVMRSASHWLATKLAQRGFVALAIRHRGSGFRGTVSGKFEDVAQDLAPWTDLMASRGHRTLVGVGHSVGSLWFSQYLAQSQDGRYKAMIYLAPTRDLPQHARLAMGEDRYARTVLEAQDAVRAGKGATHLIDAPFPQTVYDEDPRQPMFLSAPGAGYTYYYADAFLSYWGPDAKAMHTHIVPKVKVPKFSIGGSRDPWMQGGFLIEFTQAAGANAQYAFYGGPGGAPHSFEGFEARVTDDILAWLGRTL
ncbi:MAG: alpha/beta fold hydrolase [Rhodospirillaceae bacterium]|nr:alpha/beta fold hydrolase [Rhodospirillaceae bacterium]